MLRAGCRGLTDLSVDGHQLLLPPLHGSFRSGRLVGFQAENLPVQAVHGCNEVVCPKLDLYHAFWLQHSTSGCGVSIQLDLQAHSQHDCHPYSVLDSEMNLLVQSFSAHTSLQFFSVLTPTMFHGKSSTASLPARTLWVWNMKFGCCTVRPGTSGESQSDEDRSLEQCWPWL